MAGKISPTDLRAGTLPATVLGNTATVGDNTTKLATTAFVSAYRPPLSSLSGAITTSNIDNLNNHINWQWSTLNPYGLNLYSFSNVVNNNAFLFRSQLSGGNTSPNVTTYAGQFYNGKSGTNSTNVGVDIAVSGATNNYGILVRPAGGLSGFGAFPTALVHIGTQSTTVPALKFTAGGSLTTTPQDGAVEFDGTHFYGSIGSTRYQLDQQAGGGGGTWGSITGTLSAQTDLDTALGLKAPLASPTFTGTPAAPTAPTSTNTTQVATTAFVQQELTASTSYFGPMFAGAGTIGDPIIPIAAYNNQTGTTYTLVAADNGKVVTLSNASAITLTVPTSLPAGFNCSIVQLGAGQVTVAASGTTVNNRQSFTKLAGQFASATILQYATNTFITQGDMSA